MNIAYSGLYHWWYTIGMRSNAELYQGSIFMMILSAWALFAGWLHLQPKFLPSLAWFKNAESRLNHHLAVLFGFSSIAWTGHLVHVAIPESAVFMLVGTISSRYLPTQPVLVPSSQETGAFMPRIQIPPSRCSTQLKVPEQPF